MTLADSPEIPTVALEVASEPPRLLRVLAKRPYAVLALLGLLLWLPGILSLPALDRDESRFAQSSRQMVESGDPVDIRFGHVPRYKKPVGIYWLQAAATRLAGMGDDSHIWTYRLPSLLGGIAAAWATLWCALAFASAEIALTAGLLMLGSVLLTAEATIATTDAVLLACIVVVQGVLLRVYRAAREPGAPRVSTAVILWGWAAFAGGILVKGPVILGVAALTMTGLSIWDRQGRWLGGLKPVRGLLLTALLILPWLVAITIQSHGAFFEQSLGNDFAAKMAGGQESHGSWPGYFLLLSAASFWPAILFVAPGIALGVLRRGEPAIRFLLVWAGAWWVLVEAVPTKLPHYVLPAYPGLAILAAFFIWTAVEKSSWLTAARWIAVVQFVVGLVGMIAALILLPRYFELTPPWWLLTLTGVGGALAVAALVLSILRKQGWALALALAALFAFVPTLTVGVGPRLTQLWVSERLKPVVMTYTQSGDPPPALAGYQEPSLVFALGADVLLTDGAGAADAGAHQGGLALVEDAEQGAFFARLAELQTDAAAQGELSGFNYSRGRKVHITLYRVAQLKDVP
jgi:4-amino-4-deoxy-L-arabinose transferase-like glycosyltransferase